jgi:hypothetical protein
MSTLILSKAFQIISVKGHTEGFDMCLFDWLILDIFSEYTNQIITFMTLFAREFEKYTSCTKERFCDRDYGAVNMTVQNMLMQNYFNICIKVNWSIIEDL